MGIANLESAVLVASDLVVAVTVTIERSEHDTEGSRPLAEEDEEMVSQRLLGEKEAPVVDCADVNVRKTDTEVSNRRQILYLNLYRGMNVCGSSTLLKPQLHLLLREGQ